MYSYKYRFFNYRLDSDHTAQCYQQSCLQLSASTFFITRWSSHPRNVRTHNQISHRCLEADGDVRSGKPVAYLKLCFFFQSQNSSLRLSLLNLCAVWSLCPHNRPSVRLSGLTQCLCLWVSSSRSSGNRGLGSWSWRAKQRGRLVR